MSNQIAAFCLQLRPESFDPVRLLYRCRMSAARVNPKVGYGRGVGGRCRRIDVRLLRLGQDLPHPFQGLVGPVATCRLKATVLLCEASRSPILSVGSSLQRRLGPAEFLLRRVERGAGLIDCVEVGSTL